eukprot:4071709-Lingulodinium_polyedra.AAC.1
MAAGVLEVHARFFAKMLNDMAGEIKGGLEQLDQALRANTDPDDAAGKKFLEETKTKKAKSLFKSWQRWESALEEMSVDMCLRRLDIAADNPHVKTVVDKHQEHMDAHLGNIKCFIAI